MKTDVGLWTKFVIRLRFNVRLLEFLPCISEAQRSACRQKRRRFVENNVMRSAFENYANSVMVLSYKIKNDMSVSEQTGRGAAERTGVEVSLRICTREVHCSNPL